MKKLLSSILFLTLSATVALADTPTASENKDMRGRGPDLEHMRTRLGLTDEQVEQIRTLREQGGNREDLRAVLTDEQRALMDQHRAERTGRRGGQGPNFNKLKTTLGLSEEQSAQMRDIRASGGSREDMRAVLTEEQRELLDQHRAEYGRQHGHGSGKGRRGPAPSEPVDQGGD